MIDPGEITIAHHGVKGQRWGVKRKGSAVSSSVLNRKLSAQSTARESAWKDKYLQRSSMSTKELKKNVDRLNLENQFKQAVSQASPTRVSAGKKFISSVASKVIAPAAIAVASPYVKKGLESAVKAAITLSK